MLSLNRKETILVVVMVIALVISVGITYHQTIIKKNFEVVNIESDSDIQDIE